MTVSDPAEHDRWLVEVYFPHELRATTNARRKVSLRRQAAEARARIEARKEAQR